MEAMFDPIYATEVLNDILARHGLMLEITPKTPVELEQSKAAREQDRQPADERNEG